MQLDSYNVCHNFSVINSIECQLFVYKLFVYNAQCTATGGRGGGRQVETEGQTGLDTDQQVPALYCIVQLLL